MNPTPLESPVESTINAKFINLIFSGKILVNKKNLSWSRS